MKLILKEKSATQEMSTKIAQKLWNNILYKEKNFSVFLEGGLGAGKTFLVREILRAAGVTQEVPSPTYTLVNEFSVNNRMFAHFDFYRLNNPNDFFERGLSEIAENKNVSKFIEWGDKISHTAQRGFSGHKFLIRIEHGKSMGQRTINVYDLPEQ
jgi:tRNA threonylcarbamoyl adenosine modification protein YjeE